MKIGSIRLGFCALLLSGCSTFVDYPLGVPPRPVLIPLPAEMQQEIPNLVGDVMGAVALTDIDPEIRQEINDRLQQIDTAYWEIIETIAVNDASLKNHIKRLEARILLHDNSL